jgi:hypothetical protein
MKIELLSFLEWTLQLSILLNIFMAGLCGLLIYQDRQKLATVSSTKHRRGVE